jgi:hypothetical protein
LTLARLRHRCSQAAERVLDAIFAGWRAMATSTLKAILPSLVGEERPQRQSEFSGPCMESR